MYIGKLYGNSPEACLAQCIMGPCHLSKYKKLTGVLQYTNTQMSAGPIHSTFQPFFQKSFCLFLNTPPLNICLHSLKDSMQAQDQIQAHPAVHPPFWAGG